MLNEKVVAAKLREAKQDLKSLDDLISSKSLPSSILYTLLMIATLAGVYFLASNIFESYFIAIIPATIAGGIFDNAIKKLASSVFVVRRKELIELRNKKKDIEQKILKLNTSSILHQQIDKHYWLGLKGVDLEEACKILFNRYAGVKLNLTSRTGDGGIDLLGGGIAIQCKGHKNPIGEPAVRDFFGAVTSRKREISKSIFVCPSGFTEPAKKFAKGNVQLLDASALSRLAQNQLKEIEKD